MRYFTENPELLFEVYQIVLSDEMIDEVNSSLRPTEPIEGQLPAFYEKYLNVTWKPTAESIIAARDMFKKVAEIKAHTLNQVFEIGNIGPESKITRMDTMHSISIGDVIVQGQNAFFVNNLGFTRVAF